MALMFDHVSFKNFKCLVDVGVDLGRLTLLVGANGSGKSSVLDGLALLCRMMEAGPYPVETLRSAQGDGALRIAASRSGAALAWIEGRGKPRAPVAAEINVDGVATTWSTARQHHPSHLKDFARVVRLRLDAPTIAMPSHDAHEPRVQPSGEGTAVVLAWLAEQRSPALDRIEQDLRRVVPAARRLEARRVGIQSTSGDTAIGRGFALTTDSGATISAELLSEGTLLTIGLLTVLHTQDPHLLLLDDFDRALHPTAQRQLVTVVKEMLEQKPDLQIVCTTHSPYVLDLFDADNVRVLRATPHGSIARKLTDHPEWHAWKGTMKAGEFWSYVGEDWLDGTGAPQCRLTRSSRPTGSRSPGKIVGTSKPSTA